MSTVEIIVLGYLVNLFAVVFVFIGTFIIVFFQQSSPSFIMEYMKVDREIDSLKNLRDELKKQGKSWLIQEDLVFLVPFSGFLTVLKWLYGVATQGLLTYLNTRIDTIRRKLHQKLNK